MAKSFAQIGYEHYMKYIINDNNMPMEIPQWESVHPSVKGGWEAAALALLQEKRERIRKDKKRCGEQQ